MEIVIFKRRSNNTNTYEYHANNFIWISGKNGISKDFSLQVQASNPLLLVGELHKKLLTLYPNGGQVITLKPINPDEDRLIQISQIVETAESLDANEFDLR